MYPKILVFLQFSLIGLMLIFSRGLAGFLDNGMTMLLFIIGLVIGLWALYHNKLGNFHIQPKMKYNAKLITTGIYGLIRHPMYTSVITIMGSVVLWNFTVLECLLFVLLVTTLLLKAHKEEALWIEQDITYIIYKERTKFFIPYIL